jgi:hypothetical protein
MEKTESKPLAARHGAAWERHGMRELAFNSPPTFYQNKRIFRAKL